MMLNHEVCLLVLREFSTCVMLANRFFLNALRLFVLLWLSLQSAKGARLDGALMAVPTGPLINLSAEGTSDWAHWGLNGPAGFNHKQGVVPQIGALTIVGPNSLQAYSTEAHSYRWTDGTPTLSSTNNAGVLVRGLMNGFELWLPADTTLRRAKVYVGVNAAAGHFEAFLSEASVASYMDASLVHAQRSNGVYSLSYAADSPGQFLAVRFTASHLFSADSGDVSWQAVTLAGNAPPAIAIVSPTNNASFSAFDDVPIMVDASDADGTISLVEFFQGATPLGELLEGPYLLTWENVPPGAYTLTARATDNDGATTTSAPVQIRVTSNTPPTVGIIAPTNDAAFLVPADITIEATASDLEGPIAKVEFFAGNNRLGELINAPYSFIWSNAPLGYHSLTARATDANGGTGVSSPVGIFVTTDNGALLGSFATPPTSIDLTSEGIADWAHWGLLTESSFDHKDGVVPQISTYELIGDANAYPYADNPHSYSWTDGTPTLAVTNTITGVYTVGLNNGFEIRVAADTSVKTVKLYMGTFGARGKLQAYLSDFSSPPFVDSSVNNFGNGPSGVYTINFDASAPGQNLILRYTVSEMHDSFGNVTLQAATLVTDNNPPTARISGPTNGAEFIFPAAVIINASAADSDGTISKVEFFADGGRLGEVTAPPYTFTWPNAPLGSHTLTAKATDDDGATFTSRPVIIFVGIGGGRLSGQVATTPFRVNLSEEGKSDWTHWGLFTRNSFNHKRAVLPQISNFRTTGDHTVRQFEDNAAGFSWTNGTPELVAIDTHTGVYAAGLGSGFEITLPADLTPRRLKVYVGLFGARGRFEAKLSDFSAPPFIDASLENPFNNRVGVYTLQYSAAFPGQTLLIRYTASLLHDTRFGNVTLQAAALQTAPAAQILAPAWSGTGFGFSFSTETGWNYDVEYTHSLNPAVWQGLGTLPGNGTQVQIVDPSPSGLQRYYRVRTH
jgi:hypothetical protein